MSIEIIGQNQIRIEASKFGMRLWRNNSGVLNDTKGRPVRFGLGNDSKAVNARLKSGDLIGIYQGRFVSVEVKASDWRYTGNDRELAQKTWINLIRENGGIACFACDWNDVLECIKTGKNRHD